MDALTISPKFQIVIPKAIREQLGLKPGQKLMVLTHDGRIQLIPVRSVREMRGFLEGIDTTVPREKDRV